MAHILDELGWRGLVAHSTDPDALRLALDTGPLTFYVGFDPTAPSLHIGNLVQILTARRLQHFGHHPLLLVGGATGLIGDPKDSGERSLNDPAVVADWVDRLRGQIEPFLSFEGTHAARIVNNLDWTGAMSAIELLRDVGKHFSVNRMLDREAVAARLAGPGISYTEFSYVLLQSNDFLELHRRYGCALQLGGSDQWGNITAGCDLIRRVTGERVHAFATPLMTRADGQKFGKTEAGTVWLDPQMTSPFAFYQFWLNADDRDAVEYLRTFSFLTQSEVAELAGAVADRPQAREAQRALAEEMTTLVHGSDETARVVAASRALFGQGDLAGLDPGTLDAALREAAHTVAAPSSTYADLMAAVGLATSKSGARRTVAERGAYVNNRPIEDADTVPDEGDWLHGRWLVLRRGRRTVAGVERGA